VRAEWGWQDETDQASDQFNRLKSELKCGDEKDLGMSDANRKLGGLLVGFGALLVLICCAAPWLLAGLLVALGLGFALKSTVLIALTGGGLILVLAGLTLKGKKQKGSSGRAIAVTKITEKSRTRHFLLVSEVTRPRCAQNVASKLARSGQAFLG
jgi:hypothetical protein